MGPGVPVPMTFASNCTTGKTFKLVPVIKTSRAEIKSAIEIARTSVGIAFSLASWQALIIVVPFKIESSTG